MEYKRRSGILLHPTSLPGRFGVGKLGEEAIKFIDFLHESGQTYWQVLPLGPPDFANSPYDCLSAFAGNPTLIDPVGLVEEGFLFNNDIVNLPQFPDHYIDFAKVFPINAQYLYKAYDNFKSKTSKKNKDEFYNFCKKEAYWLDDYALFIAIMRNRENKPWSQWEDAIKKRDPETLETWKKNLADPIEKQKFFQFLFFKQWLSIKKYANSKGIKIIGDIPIFVSMNSADVWAHTDMFYFDSKLNPKVVSGVPPDYFSRTGQLWGHPLYNWKTIEQSNFDWWIKRFKMGFTQADVVRIDHFRGLYNYWEVPAGEKTAVNGKWKKAPGINLFNAVTNELGDVQIIAENLGDFDKDSLKGVEELRKKYSFPGMKILQFAFGSDATDHFLPHNFKNDYVVYTGTHDNDTTFGWYQETSSEKERDYARRYMAVPGNDIAWDLIRLAWSSIADTAITTVQDLLNLGHEARINTPSTMGPQNWSWRLAGNALNRDIAYRLKELTRIYGRLP